MLRSDEIQQALHAHRVVELNLPAMHGPLGLEHLMKVVEDLQSDSGGLENNVREALTIRLKSETKQKLDQLATVQSPAPTTPFSAAELAAAIVERFVSSAGV